MKRSIRSVISEVKKSLKEVNADSKAYNKFIWSKLYSKSNLIIPQYSDKLSINNEVAIYQTLKCIDIIEVPAIDPHCVLTSKFSVYRTKNKLPDLYFDNSGAIIRSIRTVDRSFNVTLATLDYIQKALEDTNSKYDKTIYAWYEEGFLYITKRFPIRIEGLFVFDISDYCDCQCEDDEDKPCRTFLDQTWFVPQKLQDQIIGQVRNDLINYKKISEDSNINKDSNK